MTDIPDSDGGGPAAPPDTEHREGVPSGVGRWWRPIGMILLAAIAVFALTRALQPDDATIEAEARTTPAPEAPPVVAAPGTTAPISTQPPVVTTPVPVSAAAVTTTTTSTTSTTASPPPSTTTSTTTTTTEPPPRIQVAGDPLPLEDLTLSILGIGPLHFGDAAGEVLGVLAASLGQPNADSGVVPGGAPGTCPEGFYRVVRWGPLAVIARVDDGDEIFESFRIDIRDADLLSPAAGLTTLSGFRAGGSIADFEAIYIPGFRVSYLEHSVEGLIYELRSNQGLLLWGPISSSEDDGIVFGIFSPDTC